MNAGQIVDMSELIDKYGTNIKQIYGEDIAKINQVEGFVYGVPNQIERGSIPAIFMRKDLVEKYNIDTTQIKEPKDLESVFETVKAGEPDMTMLAVRMMHRLQDYSVEILCQITIILVYSWIRRTAQN